MVICDLNIERVTVAPFETDSPLVINSDAVLPHAVAAQLLESICRRDSQVIEVDGIVEHAQFPQSHLLNIRWKFSRPLALINLLGFSIFEGFNHTDII